MGRLVRQYKQMNDQPRLLIVIHTCIQYEQSRCKAILETWAQKERDRISISFWTDNPSSFLPGAIYKAPYPGGCTYHPSTFTEILDHFKTQESGFDWFMVVDDDTYVYPERLLSFLTTLEEGRSLLAGDFINWPLRYPSWRSVYESCLNKPAPLNYDYRLWPGGGAGLVFSASGVSNVLDMINELEAGQSPLLSPINHDVWLHRMIEERGASRIARIHCPGFHQFGDRELLPVERSRPGVLVSVHLNHDIELMHAFHELS